MPASSSSSGRGGRGGRGGRRPNTKRANENDSSSGTPAKRPRVAAASTRSRDVDAGTDDEVPMMSAPSSAAPPATAAAVPLVHASASAYPHVSAPPPLPTASNIGSVATVLIPASASAYPHATPPPVTEDEVVTVANIDEQQSELSSIQRMRGIIDQLIAFIRDPKRSEMNLEMFAQGVSEASSSVNTDGYTVGLLGNSSTGKSLLINLILFLTSHDSIEYDSSRFRGASSQLEYVSRLDLGSKTTQQVIQLADELKAKPSLLKELTDSCQQMNNHFYEPIRTAYPSKRNTSATLFKQPGTWLLPSGQRPVRVTKVVARLHYGRTFHMVAQFHTIAEMRSMAFERFQRFRDGGDKETREVANRYKGLVSSPAIDSLKQAKEVAATPITADDLQLHDDVLAVAGQTFVYAGLGSNRQVTNSPSQFELDRSWIRQQLHELNEHLRLSFAVKSLDIFVPSKLLQDGCTLVDIPGSGDPQHEQTVRRELGECDLVLVLTPKAMNGGAGELDDAIQDSGFISNMLQNENSTKQMHFIHYTEKDSGHMVWRDEDDRSSAAKDFAEFRSETEIWLKETLMEPLSELTDVSMEVLEKRMRQCIRIYGVEPVSFASLALNNPRSLTIGLDDDSSEERRRIAEMCKATGFPELLAAISSVSLARMARSLRNLVVDGETAPSEAEGVLQPSLSLLSRLIQLYQSELQSIEGSDAPDVRAALKTLVSLGSSRVQIRQSVESAAQVIGLGRQRDSWLDTFRQECERIKEDPELRSVFDEATKAAVSAIQKGLPLLEPSNVHDFLYPRYAGSQGPLSLRRRAFGHFDVHPLNSQHILNLVRPPIERFIGERMAALFNQMLDQIIPSNLRACAPCQFAKKRALLKLGLELSNHLEKQVFSPKSPLHVDKFYTLVAKSCSQAVRNWLEQHYKTWKLPASNQTITKIRADLLAGMPSIVNDMRDILAQRLTDTFDERCKKLYWKMMHYQQFQSAISTVFREFFTELAGMQTGKIAKEELLEVIDWLNAWKRESTRILQQEELSSEERLNQLKADLMRSIAEKKNILDLILDPARMNKQPAATALLCAIRRALRNRKFIEAKRFTPYRQSDPKLRDLLKRMWKHASVPPQPDLLDISMRSRLGLNATASAPIGSQLDQLTGQLRQWGFEIAHVPADGNCLFNAIAHQLRWAADTDGARARIASESESDSGWVLDPTFLRQTAVEFIRRSVNKPELAEQFLARIGSDGSSYCDRMVQPGSWGGEPEIFSLANALGVQIALWQPNVDRPLLFTPDGHTEDMPTINIAFVNASGDPNGLLNHFVSIVPMLPGVRSANVPESK